MENNLFILESMVEEYCPRYFENMPPPPIRIGNPDDFDENKWAHYDRKQKIIELSPEAADDWRRIIQIKDTVKHELMNWTGKALVPFPTGAFFLLFVVGYPFMKHCPKCKSQYPDDMSFCLIDGEPLLVNDPEAETLKGKVLKPSKIRPIPVKGEAIEHLIWLTKDKPYSVIHAEITIILLLKETLVKNAFTPRTKSAYIAFYGNRPFHHGEKLQQVGPNEYYMPESDEYLEQDISVFYFELSKGYATLLRACVSEVQEKRVRMNVSLLLTQRES